MNNRITRLVIILIVLVSSVGTKEEIFFDIDFAFSSDKILMPEEVSTLAINTFKLSRMCSGLLMI